MPHSRLSLYSLCGFKSYSRKSGKKYETSAHTSFKTRAQAVRNKRRQRQDIYALVGDNRQNRTKGIAYQLKDYCELVDHTPAVPFLQI